MPPCYFFVIDVSFAAVSSGMLGVVAATIKNCLDALPGNERTQIGFLTFDRCDGVWEWIVKVYGGSGWWEVMVCVCLSACVTGHVHMCIYPIGKHYYLYNHHHDCVGCTR